ncbi:hypothetical protein QYF48_18775 [Brevibacillus agri]|uniref:hypothetical protein n=1 Tax=Brevibacillus agri TaxID=51101 RepID=UPI0025B66057|nr:hypothetical protein [Brevibacillus agri]MDN4094839.1 hypothetical protein [Brevibacillus agri]
MHYQAINLSEELSSFHELWSPKVVGEINDFQFKLVKIDEDFIWHEHPGADKEQNYKITDIASIDVTYSRKFGDYSAQVILSDEKETKYYYRIDEKVKQSGYNGKTNKHRES